MLVNLSALSYSYYLLIILLRSEIATILLFLILMICVFSHFGGLVLQRFCQSFELFDKSAFGFVYCLYFFAGFLFL